MISLLLGFLTSGIPHVLDFFKSKQEDAAEAERQREQNRHDEAMAANKERQAVIDAQAAMQAAAGKPPAGGEGAPGAPPMVGGAGTAPGGLPQ